MEELRPDEAKPPTLTLVGRKFIASTADNVRLSTEHIATKPQQADQGLSKFGKPGNVGRFPLPKALRRPIMVRSVRKLANVGQKVHLSMRELSVSEEGGIRD
jgi:hypothetical protein